MVNMINASSITWDILKEKEIYYDTSKTKLVKIKSLMSYIQKDMVSRDKKDILTDILTLCGLTVTKITTPNATSIMFQTESSGKYGFLQVVLNRGVKVECTTVPAAGMVYFKPFESSSNSDVKSISISNNSATITGGNGVVYSFGYVAVCMEKYSAYHNMQAGINPLDWAQNRVLLDINDLPNNTTSLTNNSSYLAWTSLGKYYINNKQVQYFSVPTVAEEVQLENQPDNQGGWFIFNEEQDFGLAKQSKPKNFALVDSTEIPDQIIFENFSNSASPNITWVDDKTIQINDSNFYIGEKGKVMVIKRGSAQTHTVSHELKDCSFWSSWGGIFNKKDRTIYSKITTEWNSNSISTAPSRPGNKKVNVSLSSFSLQQGQLAQGQTSLSAITYSTISSHKLLTTTTQAQEINKDLSLPLKTSSLWVDGYVPQDPAFYLFVGQTATIKSSGGMAGGGSSKSYASAYLRLKIQVTDLPIIKNQDTWLSASIGELHSDGHYVNDKISYADDYEHYLCHLWDLNLNPGLLNKDIDIYGKKTDTIQQRTWLNTSYNYFPKNSSTQPVFQETKNDYTSSVYCGLGFLNNSDDYAYCIYITYTE